jgi:hypothetical protein
MTCKAGRERSILGTEVEKPNSSLQRDPGGGNGCPKNEKQLAMETQNGSRLVQGPKKSWPPPEVAVFPQKGLVISKRLHFCQARLNLGIILR